MKPRLLFFFETKDVLRIRNSDIKTMFKWTEEIKLFFDNVI